MSSGFNSPMPKPSNVPSKSLISFGCYRRVNAPKVTIIDGTPPTILRSDRSADFYSPMPDYFIYSRKSSEAEDRQVLSIESQITELTRLAEARRLRVCEILTETRSAKEPGRPVFQAMMQRISRGEAQGIICCKLDRLARNPIEGGAIIWALKQNGLEIVTPTQTFRQSDDTTILTYIEFGMAQKYVDDLSRNVKRGLRTKAEKSWYPSVAPLGYLNNKHKE